MSEKDADRIGYVDLTSADLSRLFPPGTEILTVREHPDHPRSLRVLVRHRQLYSLPENAGLAVPVVEIDRSGPEPKFPDQFCENRGSKQGPLVS